MELSDSDFEAVSLSKSRTKRKQGKVSSHSASSSSLPVLSAFQECASYSSAVSDDYFTPSCPVCQTVFPSFSDKKREDHVIRCLRKAEKNSQIASTTPVGGSSGSFSALPASCSTVADEQICPCCESVSLSPRELEVHLQTCGMENRPSTRRTKKQPCLSLKAIKKLDEGTQVALALSASLVAQEPPSYQPGPSRSKLKFVRPSPSLIERDPSDTSKIIAGRVAAVVGRGIPAADRDGGLMLPESRFSHRSMNSDDSVELLPNRRMWNVTEEEHTDDIDGFYVSALMPPISPYKTEEKRLMSLSQIPGFRLPLDATQHSTKIHQVAGHRCTAASNKTATGTHSTVPRKLVRLVSSSESESELPSPSLLTDNLLDDPAEAVSNSCTADLPDESVTSEDDESDSQTLILFSSSESEPDDDEADIPKISVVSEEEGKNNLSDDVALEQLTRKERDKQLAKYGVKPLPKDQAVAFLKTVNRMSAKKSTKHRVRTKQRKETAVVGPVVRVKNKLSSMPSDATTEANLQKKSAKPLAKPKISRDRNAKDHCKEPSEGPVSVGVVPIISSKNQKRIKLISSSSEGVSADDEEQAAVADKQTKSNKLKTPEEVRLFMRKYIEDRPPLHEQILRYETVYIKLFLKQLKADRVVVKADLLMDFFDSQSICFSQHDHSKPRPWGGKLKT